MRCCVPLCTNTSDNASTSERTGITFCRLPNEVNLRDTWLKALGIQEHHLPDPAVVCSQHFSDDNFSNTKSCTRQIHSICNALTVQDIPEVEAVVIKEEDCSVYEDNCVSNEKYSNISIKIELEGRDETLKEDIFHRKAATFCTAVADHMTKTESCMKSENVTFGCTLCLLDFVEETAYNEHMVMHFQDAGNDTASQVCEPLAAVNHSGDSLVLQNKTGSQRLSDEPPPAAGCAQGVVVPLLTKLAPNYQNKVEATEEAGASQRKEQILKTNIGELGNPSSQSGIITYIDVNSIKLGKRPKKPKNVVLDDNPRVRTHTAAKLYTCEICNHEFTAKCNLLMHKKIHTGEKPYSCEICNYKCAQKGSLSLHMRTHTGEKPFSCEICNSKFTAKSNLLVHKKIHTGEKPYTCEICNQKFARKFPLILHKRTHTGEKPYSCEMCDYKCIRKPNLSQHMRTHTSEKPFSCDSCNYTSSDKSNLLVHIRTHTGEKPYSCKTCNFRCANKSNLLVHMRTHTGEKLYSCEICNLKFTQKIHLSGHKRTHTGEKPYTCEICNYKCAEKNTLQVHKRIHSGEKPYSCKVCNYKCAQTSSLYKHMKTHTDVKRQD